MKKILSLILVVCLLFTLFGCTKSETRKLNILALKGPTGMGMAKMITDNDEKYLFNIIADPTMIASSITSGEADIAACPLNMAAMLYNKTEGNIQILAINTLGTLYILDKSNSINSVEDLKGKTIVTSGQGATPEYALNCLLDIYGIKDSVNIEYKTEHSEVATAILSGSADIVMLPEPNVSVVTSKNSDIKIAVDVSKEIENKSALQFAMGCIIAKKDFVENNKEDILKFLKDYKKSVETINSSETAGQIICDAGILDNSVIAQKSIKTSSICFITDDEMKIIAFDNFNLLLGANPKSIGGKLPDEDICFIEK